MFQYAFENLLRELEDFVQASGNGHAYKAVSLTVLLECLLKETVCSNAEELKQFLFKKSAEMNRALGFNLPPHPPILNVGLSVSNTMY